MNKYCPNCKRIYVEEKSLGIYRNFCTHCQTRLVEDQRKDTEIISDEIAVIRNKIIWNVPKGELAYKVRKEDIETLSGVKGIVVDEGMTAYIYTDGVLTSVVHEGNYDFIDTVELEKKLRARYGGIADGWNRIKKAMSRFWFGLSLYDSQEQNNGIEAHATMEQVIDSLRKKAFYTIILKVDKEFQLIFEVPIATPQLEGTVGLNLSLKITDFREFIQHYELNGANRRVSALDVRNQLSRVVEACIKSESFEMGKVTESTISIIMSRLQAQIGAMNCGLSVTRINDCTIDSADLERLRGIEREIYLSGEELDRLHKINIIKNRLSSEENQQKIEEARNDMELARQMAEINRDKILTDDEMEKFTETITYARRLRTARSQEEYDSALDGIRRAQMLRESDIEMLKSELDEKKYRQETAFTLLQLQDSINRSNIEREASHQAEISEAGHQVSISRIKDAYNDERFIINLKQENEKFNLWKDQMTAMIDLEIKQNEAVRRGQMEIINTLHTNKLETQKEKNRHEEKILETKKEMSDKQILASSITNMTPEAQVGAVNAIYNADVANAKAEAERKAAEKIESITRDNTEKLTDITLQAIRALGGNLERDREYTKERLQRTEDRNDRQQEHILNRAFDKKASESSIASSTIPVQPVIAPQAPLAPKTTKILCPKCNKENNLADGNFCAYCGHSLIDK